MLCPFKSCGNGCNCVRDYGVSAIVVVLSMLVWLLKLNQPLFLAINSMHMLLPVGVWQAINFISAPRHFILPIVLLLITVLYRRKYIAHTLLVVVLYYFLFFTLKRLLGEARPFMVLAHNSFYLLPNAGDMIKEAYHSFPSGHTGLMVVFSLAIVRIFSINSMSIKVALFLLPVIVGITRIATGWHWPLDVLGSAICAYLLVLGCFWNVTNK